MDVYQKDAWPVAIIGCAGILPGSRDISEYWANLCGGVESVGSIPPDRKKDLEGYHKAVGIESPKYKTMGYISDISIFDFEYFKITRREAFAMPPSQRLFLQTAISAMEDAGYGGRALASTNTGVFVGYIGDLDGAVYQDILRVSTDKQSPTGILSANISGRLSYFMDFTGPSVLIDSACSSSLSALIAACHAVSLGECEQALVGSVQIAACPVESVMRAGIESEDGHTRPFDDDTTGTGEGEGVLAVMIKPLRKAIADGDNIYCVIRAYASNQDGYSIGLSAPNPNAQMNLYLDAYRRFNIDPRSISHMELHGTGTIVGDPIEFDAMSKAFSRLGVSGAQKFCTVSSVKSNIGHLYASSGLASLVKCCMMLREKNIPASVNLKKVNKRLRIDSSPFEINTVLRNWDTMSKPRRCGINNFGFSGTNCHVVLEEYNGLEQKQTQTDQYIFVLSAENRESLAKMIDNYTFFLEQNPDTDMNDLCYTAAVGRGHYRFRLAVMADSIACLYDRLQRFGGRSESHIYYGYVNIVPPGKKTVRFGDLTPQDIAELNKIAADFLTECNYYFPETSLQRVSSLYVAGAQINWKQIFVYGKRISLPTYAFAQEKCWPEF